MTTSLTSFPLFPIQEEEESKRQQSSDTTADSGMGSDFWGSLKGMSVKDIPTKDQQQNVKPKGAAAAKDQHQSVKPKGATVKTDTAMGGARKTTPTASPPEKDKPGKLLVHG